MFIDTHAHLNFPDYQNDLKRVIADSLKAGVKKIICASSNIADSERAIEIARQFPGIVFVSVGIHPQQTDPQNSDSLKKQIQQLRALATEKEIVAIGETGLDYSPAPPEEKNRSKKGQTYLFEEQIKLAIKHKLPLIIHSREAFADTIDILKKFKTKGVLHCYTAGKKGIAKVQALGYYFGFDGNLTYDNGLQNVAKIIPLEQILLETDCPCLTPEPFRGQRNEPKNIALIAEKLAEIKNLSIEEIAGKTTQNANQLFNLLDSEDKNW